MCYKQIVNLNHPYRPMACDLTRGLSHNLPETPPHPSEPILKVIEKANTRPSSVGGKSFSQGLYFTPSRAQK